VDETGNRGGTLLLRPNWYIFNLHVKTFTTWQQYITVLHSQITQKDSLRDIETGLGTQSGRWYHLGLKGVHGSTLSDDNTKRDCRIFEDMFYHLLV